MRRSRGSQFGEFLQSVQARARKREMVKQVLLQQQDSEKAAVSLGNYLRAQEKSQTEVVQAWDAFQESVLSNVLRDLAHLGVTEVDLEVEYGPTNEHDWSGEAVVSVRGVPFIRMKRANNSLKAEESKSPIDWEFSAEVIEDETSLEGPGYRDRMVQSVPDKTDDSQGTSS
jgi:hypothetical protein